MKKTEPSDKNAMWVSIGNSLDGEYFSQNLVLIPRPACAFQWPRVGHLQLGPPPQCWLGHYYLMALLWLLSVSPDTDGY